jgi:hypothetical protein
MSGKLELGRRGLILGATALALAPRPVLAAPGKLTFAVFRNGTKVGQHEMVISGDEANLTATADVAMNIKAGPITLFKYRHRAVERWKGGAFAAIETWTEQTGKKPIHVVAQAGGGAVTITGPAGVLKGPADAAPLTHWNPVAFTRPMFNQQEGKFLKVKATKMAPNHWAVRGEAEIDDFYDSAGQWLALKGKLEDGSTLEYKRI